LDFKQLKNEFENELTENILPFWIDEVYDPSRKTFYGRIANSGEKFPDAPLSAVFTTRLMWTFSAVYRRFPRAEYQQMAGEAFRILRETFWDNVNGGIFWSVTPDGTPVETKKQFYAQAFFIYALSEYYLAFRDEKARKLAVSMFLLVEAYAHDAVFGGYCEARSAGWQEPGDQRLSGKDMNVRKSMNTHLHILEAYTNLYRIWKDEKLKMQLTALTGLFLQKIICPETSRFNLFFDEDWTVRSAIDSFGHDIEGSWLLVEAAEVLDDPALLRQVKEMAVKMAVVTEKEGISPEGGVYNEREEGRLLARFDWWPQAEAVVGFFNAWQLTGDEKFLHRAVSSWKFIQQYIIDHENGDWFWGVDENCKVVPEDKVNGWKASYHNGRMCLEMIHRIERFLK
jgi:mannobiose 2-epimerase